MTEICVQVMGEIEEVKQAVIDKGFHFVESYNNYDTYFTPISESEVYNTPYKVLLDNSLIVRRILGDNCDKKNILYKKKTLDDKGNVIKEIKTKVSVDDIDKLKSIFNNLNLTCWCDYVNQNNEFKKGDIVINVQYVEELGTFIEIEEYPSISNKTDEEKFTILVDIVNSLGFPIGEDYSCKKPYMFLKQKITQISSKNQIDI